MKVGSEGRSFRSVVVIKRWSRIELLRVEETWPYWPDRLSHRSFKVTDASVRSLVFRPGTTYYHEIVTESVIYLNDPRYGFAKVRSNGLERTVVVRSVRFERSFVVANKGLIMIRFIDSK